VTTPRLAGHPAASQQAIIDAALLMLRQMGLSPDDLVTVPGDRPPVPTFAEYVPVVSAAVTDGTRRAYGSYWNRITGHWGERRLDQRVAAAGRARPLIAVAGQLMALRALSHYRRPGPGTTRARTGRGRAGAGPAGLPAAGALTTSMSSPGWQPKMSHSAASVARLSRSGTPVTSRYTCSRDSLTPRSASSGPSSVVAYMSLSAISRRRCHR